MSELPWDDVRLFLALARGGSLAAAGRILAVDSSTVSRRLAALEARLELGLFDRRPDGLAATEAASSLIAAAEEAEAAMLRFAREADALDEALAGEVRISAPPGVVDSFLVPAVPRLRARHPAIEPTLIPSTELADLTRREADVAIRAQRPSRGDLVMTKVLEVRLAVLAAPALAARLGAIARREDAPWILSAEDGAAPHRSEAVDLSPVLRSSAALTQLAAVEAGLGVAILPRIYTQVRPLVVVPLGGALAARVASIPPQDVYLVGHRALRGIPRVAAVWAFLLDEIRAIAERDAGGGASGQD